jgi:hypothetical protein
VAVSGDPQSSFRIERHLSDVRSAWIFINNHFEGFAPESCQRLAKRLGFELSLPSELQPTTSQRGQLDLQL